eukprot:7975183-Pyramimonas_sp.AAC.2
MIGRQVSGASHVYFLGRLMLQLLLGCSPPSDQSLDDAIDGAANTLERTLRRHASAAALADPRAGQYE